MPETAPSHSAAVPSRAPRRGAARAPLAAALLAASFLAAALLATTPAPARDGATDVDVELVLAVDVSYSMDEEEQRLQREGYAEALTSRAVVQAIRGGAVGRIGVAYVEWAGAADQRVLIPWTVIEGEAGARAFAERLLSHPYRRASRTSIAGAIAFSAGLFAGNGLRGTRRVIDVSGDGPNNQGRPVTEARDAAVAAGITINGLPLVLQRAARSSFDVDDLDLYYADCVVGGPGAFVEPVRSREEFARATRNKVLREVAGGVGPTALVRPAQFAPAPDRPPQDCFLGEKQWRDRFGN